MTFRWDSKVSATCEECGYTGTPWHLEMHRCEIEEFGGRCEDYPACGHTDGDGCQALPQHTSEYWAQVARSGHSRLFYEQGTPEWYDALEADEEHAGEGLEKW